MTINDWCSPKGTPWRHNGSRILDLTHWRDSLFWHGRCKGCPPAALGGPAGVVLVMIEKGRSNYMVRDI